MILLPSSEGCSLSSKTGDKCLHKINSPGVVSVQRFWAQFVLVPGAAVR